MANLDQATVFPEIGEFRQRQRRTFGSVSRKAWVLARRNKLGAPPVAISLR